MSKTDQVHTRLARHGWAMTKNMPEGRYFYQRGDQWIELNADGTAYFGVENRRMSNGTHESIVARFGETPDPTATAHAHATLDRLEAFWEEHVSPGDPRSERFYAETKKLREEIDRLVQEG